MLQAAQGSPQEPSLIPDIPMPEYAEVVTGLSRLDNENAFCVIRPCPERALRYRAFEFEKVTIAIDQNGNTLLCWSAQTLPFPWVVDPTIELLRFPVVD